MTFHPKNPTAIQTVLFYRQRQFGSIDAFRECHNPQHQSPVVFARFFGRSGIETVVKYVSQQFTTSLPIGIPLEMPMTTGRKILVIGGPAHKRFIAERG